MASALAASAWSLLPSSETRSVKYDGSDWHLKGEGVVCCPCAVPCPCRTNGPATYGHCEATLYLRIKEGRYAATSLDGMDVVDTGGACSMSYEKLSALYFDRAATPEQRTAFMKLVGSFSPGKTADFPYVRIVAMQVRADGGPQFAVMIPGVLEMQVDRNWGRPEPPMAMTAGADPFSNLLQYAENIRYKMHDPAANLDFDYSRRQANYRAVDLDASQYRTQSMLIQFEDGRGWFNEAQLRLIETQGLPLPDRDGIRRQVLTLKRDAK